MALLTYEIRVEGAPQAVRALDGVDDAARDAAGGMKAADDASGDLGRGLGESARAAQAADRAFEEAAKSAEKAGRAADDAGGGFGGLNEGVKGALGPFDEINGRIGQVGAALGILSGAALIPLIDTIGSVVEAVDRWVSGAEDAQAAAALLAARYDGLRESAADAATAVSALAAAAGSDALDVQIRDTVEYTRLTRERTRAEAELNRVVGQIVDAGEERLALGGRSIAQVQAEIRAKEELFRRGIADGQLTAAQIRTAREAIAGLERLLETELIGDVAAQERRANALREQISGIDLELQRIRDTAAEPLLLDQANADIAEAAAAKAEAEQRRREERAKARAEQRRRAEVAAEAEAYAARDRLSSRFFERRAEAEAEAAAEAERAYAAMIGTLGSLADFGVEKLTDLVDVVGLLEVAGEDAGRSLVDSITEITDVSDQALGAISGVVGQLGRLNEARNAAAVESARAAEREADAELERAKAAAEAAGEDVAGSKAVAAAEKERLKAKQEVLKAEQAAAEAKQRFAAVEFAIESVRNIASGVAETAKAAGSYPDVLGMVTHGIAAASHFAAAALFGVQAATAVSAPATPSPAAVTDTVSTAEDAVEAGDRGRGRVEGSINVSFMNAQPLATKAEIQDAITDAIAESGRRRDRSRADFSRVDTRRRR